MFQALKLLEIKVISLFFKQFTIITVFLIRGFGFLVFCGFGVIGRASGREGVCGVGWTW